MNLTREQKRGQKAYEHAESVKESPEKADYGRYAHKLPIMIRTAGLAQALAFTEAKGKVGALRLLDDLGEQLRDQGMLPKDIKNAREALIKQSKSAELSSYWMITREIQACLVWYKRFAVSVLKVEPSEDGEN